MADQMDIDPPSEENTTTQPQQQPSTQQPPKKKTSSSSTSTRELTTCTIKSPPFSYVHLSTVNYNSDPEPQGTTTTVLEIDTLQVRSYCTATLRQFLGETGSSIVPDILLIRKNQDDNKGERSQSRNGKAGVDIYLRLARQDLATFAAAMTAFPGLWTTSGNGNATGNRNGNGKSDREEYRLLLQVQSCGDWLGSLIGKSEEGDIWGL